MDEPRGEERNPRETHSRLSRGVVIEPGAIFALLEHLVEGAALPDCEAVFTWMEGNRAALAVPSLWNRGKLILLRTCNNLLRRLSRAAHTVFCGRVLLLLAALFPLSERSALNITGAYNRGNVTVWDAPEVAAKALNADDGAAGEAGQAAEEGEVEGGVPLDGAFYDAFWALQHSFNHMPSVLPPAGWAKFAAGVELLLSSLESDPLPRDCVPHHSAPLGVVADDAHVHDGNGEVAGGNAPAATGATPKYLTSATLLRLELRDPAFRRPLLLQALLLLRFATGPPAPVTALKAPAAEQAAKLITRVSSCLAAVPPDGPAFLARVESALERDHNWVAWKATGCKELFERPSEPEPAPVPAAQQDVPGDKAPGGMRKRRPPPPRDAHYTVRLGNAELDRLWNEHGNLNEAARSTDRGPPSHLSFLDPVREQLDPAWCAEMDIEEGMKRKHDKTFCWKALRLVCRANLGAFTKAAERDGGADMDNITREVFGMPRAPPAVPAAAVKSPAAAEAMLASPEPVLPPAGHILAGDDVDAGQGAVDGAPAVDDMNEDAAVPSLAEQQEGGADAAIDAGATADATAAQEEEEERMLAAMEAEAAAAEADVLASPPPATSKKRSADEMDADA